jgi:hypothetical protein
LPTLQLSSRWNVDGTQKRVFEGSLKIFKHTCRMIRPRTLDMSGVATILLMVSTSSFASLANQARETSQLD